MSFTVTNSEEKKRKFDGPDDNLAPLKEGKCDTFFCYDLSPIVAGLGKFTGKINASDIEPIHNLSFEKLIEQAKEVNKLFILAICQIRLKEDIVYKYYDAEALNTCYQINTDAPSGGGTINAIYYYSLNKIEKTDEESLNDLDFSYRGKHNCCCENIKERQSFMALYVKALKGCHESQQKIGECFQRGEAGLVSADKKMAFDWAEKSANGGNARAQCLLSIYYEKGFGTEKNDTIALDWLQKSALNGCAEAQYKMADYSLKLEKKPTKSFEWLEKVAKQGYAKALYELGQFYEKGIGTEKDIKKAFECYEKAANKGFTRAIEIILNAWIADSEAKGDKEEAVKRIKFTFSEKLSFLDLFNLNLTSLPCCLGYLSNLEELHLDQNKFSTVPTAIWQLSKLQRLSLRDTELTIIPGEIKALLQLKRLDLRYNNLISLPVEIGLLSNLEELWVDSNPNLDDLPIGLGEIPLRSLTFDDTKIPNSLGNAILSACKSQRDEFGRLIFSHRFGAWLVASGDEIKSKKSKDLIKKFNPKGKEPLFSQAEINTLNEWLWRLEKTHDYQYCQKELAGSVCQMLESLTTSQEFKELFFAQIETNNEGCQDRAAMALNELYTVWAMITSSKKGSIKEDLLFMIKTAKTLALRRILAQKIDNYQKQNKEIVTESVEIYLYYETTLKKELELQTAINQMTYGTIGKQNWIDQKALVKEVNDTYLDDLVGSSIFEKRIEKEETFIQLWTKLEEEYEDTMSKLEPSSFEKEMDYLNSINQLNAEKKQAKSDTMKEWIRNTLKN